MSRWASVEGSSFPLGMTWIAEEQAYNFALYSKHAARVTLLLYKEGDVIHPVFTYQLDYLQHKSGRVWHCRIPRHLTNEARYYAYMIDGPEPNGRYEWHHFDPQKVLLDPYARAVFFPPTFERQAAIGPGSNVGKAPLGLLSSCEDVFDWGRDKHPRHESDAIIYELHVKAFTNHPHSGVSPDGRGTYAGLIEKIPYLKELGITVVELMPVFQYDSQEGNAWGYMPLNFFAPHHAYAVSKTTCDQHHEFRTLVKALHEANIEVVLDVVYNHTGEGNQAGPVYSFKGIDNSTYYFMSDKPWDPYANFSGTGNTLNCVNRYVRTIILDSMRHWVRDMHVDGFRFDLASIFARNEDGSLNWDIPPLFSDIASDPDLANVRLIAEPWDAAGAYQLGRSLPALRWAQWNGRFRDEVRRFVKGDPGLVPSFMSRLYGSDDLFPDDLLHAFRPFQSLNYITSHDGFTLYDLVAYNHKRNWANGHQNTDGPTDNYSWNCGVEGDEHVLPEVTRLRKQQIKNFCCLLFLSNGTPMLRAGDEFMQTQQGNSNPYNQDNAIAWLDWDRLQQNRDIFRFFQHMIAFRKAHPSLCRSRFWREDIRWYGVGPEVDLSYQSHSVAFCLQGASQQDDDVYVMINAYWEALAFTIQDGPANHWRRVIDTSLDSPQDFCEPGTELPVAAQRSIVNARSIVVLLRSKE